MRKPLSIEKIKNKIDELIKNGREKKEIEVCHYCGWVGLRKDADKIYISSEENRISYEISCPERKCGKRIRVLTKFVAVDYSGLQNLLN